MRPHYINIYVIGIYDTGIDITYSVKKEWLKNKMLMSWCVVSQLRRKSKIDSLMY